jgi:16S rRNA (guanine966-N2)-methyltransferase
MTRVVAGAARGRRLQVPAGAGTRPTSDRAREGLFSSLQSLLDLEGSRVLDLFAGSGALGLEALSRGAAAVTLVEDDPAALRALHANTAAVGLPGARVVADRVERFLAGPPEAPGLDLALLDPPYEADVVPVLAALLPWLADDAVVAVERASRDPDLAWPQGFRPLRARRYGAATLWYGSRS